MILGCPIRRSADQRVLTSPHSLSQRVTSFIACICQGIHQMPFIHLKVIAISVVSFLRDAHAPLRLRSHLVAREQAPITIK